MEKGLKELKAIKDNKKYDPADLELIILSERGELNQPEAITVFKTIKSANGKIDKNERKEYRNRGTMNETNESYEYNWDKLEDDLKRLLTHEQLGIIHMINMDCTLQYISEYYNCSISTIQRKINNIFEILSKLLQDYHF